MIEWKVYAKLFPRQFPLVLVLSETRVESRRKNPEQSSSESIVKRNFLFCHQLSFKSYTIRRQFKHFLFNAHSPPPHR